ncbi:LacI family DNA-binding transcriptional regulator [Segetibacter aerophilus]|uniref:LacI family transcriptional regulator n=1 Tax=Segetibacter aerophilus TaxID=670293 RepID=A0A512BDV7_9BACT|nr:LacI family DNA-binding transcriptional regulator [Segetibacter aerophilus]GEO10152.1 LacI family transcriptional regulator [Segetibacter aerophilus]
MKFEAVTIKDIARELGISTSTVSRALRDSYEISAETKRIVLECAEKLHYTPNPIALSLKEKRSRSIAVVVCEIANSFFSQVINGIESIAYNKGYNVIISQSHESFEREVTDLQFLASRSIDGLIISVSSETENMEHLKKLFYKGLPIVFFDRVSEEMDTHLVMVDNFNSAYKATVHLIENGYKTIACLTNSAHLSITKERIAGYKKAIEDSGELVNEDLIKYCNHGGVHADETEKAMNELINLEKRPDAIIGLSDKLTTGALRFLQKQGISIPKEMGLIGFSNGEFTEFLNPSLSIIRQPAFKMGQTAIELLLAVIESKRPVQEFTRCVLETELIVRDSTSRNK